MMVLVPAGGAPDEATLAVRNVVESTERYERWLGQQIEIVPKDLAKKHERMREDAFVFFRATYYRWLERIGEVVPELDGPRIACVGDLHAENFGTWRDGEGRMVWGVNDFDESEVLPYTFDLARLATSAELAIGVGLLKVNLDDACEAILDGYRECLADGGRPFVLAGRHERLAGLVAAAVPDSDGWWEEMLGLKRAKEDVPAAALDALEPLLPAQNWQSVARRRVAGVGSLGHRRLVMTGDRDGAPAARELKELSPPAGRWLGRPQTASAEESPDVVRSPDPLRCRRGAWVCRRLAPDCVKLDLSDLGKRARERRLLEWMGAETANIHLGGGQRFRAVAADLDQRPSKWLARAAAKLAKDARHDYRDWRRRKPYAGARA